MVARKIMKITSDLRAIYERFTCDLPAIYLRFTCDFFDLIKQIQDRTKPTITLLPHKLTIDGTKLLVLEIPFSMQMHSTSRGEYLVRSNNGNKIIEPHEMATIMSEKSLIIYDQKTRFANEIANGF